MAKSSVQKYVKKQGKRLVKAAKKRYTKRGAPLGLNMKQIAADVMTLKKLVNAEKKRTTLDSNSYEFRGSVGQLNTAVSGHHIQDISPSAIVVGNGYNQRNGNSIKLHSLVIKGQLIQQANTVAATKVIIEVWMRKTDIVTTAVAEAQIFNGNPFVTGLASSLYDYHSVRNPDYFNDYIRLAAKNVKVQSDNLSPSTPMVSNFTIPLLLNQHAKWNQAGLYEQNQYIVTMRADNGNMSAIVPAGIGSVATVAASTGLDIAYQWQYFYYDN